MYRKTHFKPKPNLFKELVREFGTHFVHLGLFWRRISSRYPRQLFVVMLASILLSGALAFTVLRVRKVEPLPTLSGPSVTHGFGQIIQSGQALKEVLDLQNQINTILHKESLTAADSLLVKSAISRLETIHYQLSKKSTE